MSFIDTIAAFFRRPAEETRDEVPEGACPNCWGRFEYDNVVREMIKDRQVNVLNNEEHYAFIQAFVVEHIDGIKLKNTNHGLECPRCRQLQPG